MTQTSEGSPRIEKPLGFVRHWVPRLPSSGVARNESVRIACLYLSNLADHLQEELQRRRLAVGRFLILLSTGHYGLKLDAATLDRLRTAPSGKTRPNRPDSDEYDPYTDMVNSRRRDSLLDLAMKEAFASRHKSRDAMRTLAMQEALDERHALQKESADALKKRDEHRRQALMPVLAQIISVGRSKQHLERSEIGPAPHGFQYVHLE
jgi:hypothetical protein